MSEALTLQCLLHRYTAAVVERYSGRPIRPAALDRAQRAAEEHVRPIQGMIWAAADVLDPVTRRRFLEPSKVDYKIRVIVKVRAAHPNCVQMEDLRRTCHDYEKLGRYIEELIREGWLARRSDGRLILGPHGQEPYGTEKDPLTLAQIERHQQQQLLLAKMALKDAKPEDK